MVSLYGCRMLICRWFHSMGVRCRDVDGFTLWVSYVTFKWFHFMGARCGDLDGFTLWVSYVEM